LAPSTPRGRSHGHRCGVFPTAKLVLGHLGESLPFLAWRIQHGINSGPNGRSTKKRLSDYFADNIWVTTSGTFGARALH
jgi:predicted TIM-barrel fold metal-dependent hydrolase